MGFTVRIREFILAFLFSSFLYFCLPAQRFLASSEKEEVNARLD